MDGFDDGHQVLPRSQQLIRLTLTSERPDATASGLFYWDAFAAVSDLRISHDPTALAYHESFMHMHQSFVATGGGWDKSSSRFNRNSVSRTLIKRKRCQPRSPPAPAFQDAGALNRTPRVAARFWSAVDEDEGMRAHTALDADGPSKQSRENEESTGIRLRPGIVFYSGLGLSREFRLHSVTPSGSTRSALSLRQGSLQAYPAVRPEKTNS